MGCCGEVSDMDVTCSQCTVQQGLVQYQHSVSSLNTQHGVLVQLQMIPVHLYSEVWLKLVPASRQSDRCKPVMHTWYAIDVFTTAVCDKDTVYPPMHDLRLLQQLPL